MNKVQKLIKFTLFVVIFGGLLTHSVNVEAANLKPFAVIRPYGYDNVLIADSNSYYFISFGYGCSSYDFPEGGVIYIDTYYTPGYFNDIYVGSSGAYETCSVTDSETIDNPHPFYVQTVNDSDDQIVVTDQKGNHYLVEYGIGCLGIWNYEGKSIYIDIGGSYLDGIGDTIYLFGRDQNCRVWDGDSIPEPKIPALPETNPVIPRPITSLPKLPKVEQQMPKIESITELAVEEDSNEQPTVVEQSNQAADAEIANSEVQNENYASAEEKKGWFAKIFISIKNWFLDLF